MHLKNTEEITIVNYWIKRSNTDKIEACERRLLLLLLIYYTLPLVEGVEMPKYPLPRLDRYKKYKTRNIVITKQFAGSMSKPLDKLKQHLIMFTYNKFKKVNLERLEEIALYLRKSKKISNKKDLTHAKKHGILNTRDR